MDIYDQDIEYLRQNPRKIPMHWNMWSPLFRTADGSDSLFCKTGCLTQIKLGEKSSGNPEFDKKIKSDNNIPTHKMDITVDHLELFAKYQRELDTMFVRSDITEYVPSNYEEF